MADRSLSIEDIRESKLYTPSNTIPRLGSDASYVALRETAKLTRDTSNAKQKKQRHKATKKPRNLHKQKKPLTSTSSHTHNKHTRCSGLCIHRFVQFLVLFLSVSALAIVILMILGVVRPYPGEMNVFLTNFTQLMILSHCTELSEGVCFYLSVKMHFNTSFIQVI